MTTLPLADLLKRIRPFDVSLQQNFPPLIDKIGEFFHLYSNGHSSPFESGNTLLFRFQSKALIQDYVSYYGRMPEPTDWLYSQLKNQTRCKHACILPLLGGLRHLTMSL